MSDYIPNEILVEILVRLPARSLLRFASVCKSWHSIITSPSFVTTHLNQTITYSKRNSNKLLFRFYTDKDNKEQYLLCPDDEKFGDEFSEFGFPFQGPVGYFRIVGSCSGLLCLCDDYFRETHDVIIWNPSIRKWVTLNMSCPQGPYMFVLGFGAHPTTHEYKVVRILYEKEDLSQFKVPPKVELYTQSSGSWRDIHSAGLSCCLVEFAWSQAFVSGAVHWIAYDPRVVDGHRSWILSFSIADEVFSDILLPQTVGDQPPTCLSLKSFEESLAVVLVDNIGTDSCCIWVMKEYGVVESWTKLFIVHLPGMFSKTLGFRKNSEVLLSTRNGSLLSYDPGTKTMSDTGIRGNLHSFTVENFLETLVLVND